ncbi:MAG: TatD family hydrolase [Deltaproteobacteria bacterium]|nr:TatD family hydrolase [Deltaproteobacteria bacterium]
MWIDTHCHLAGEEFDADRTEVLKRAREAGVQTIIVIGAGDGLEGNRHACALAEKTPSVYVAVGVQPHDAGKVPDDYIEIMKSTFFKGEGASKIVAIGETGLDYHYEHAPRDVQKKCFREQLKLAKTLALPVTIHSREAWEDTLRILKEEAPFLKGGVFHCFGGGVEEAKEALELGFTISISGIVTFKKAEKLLEVVKFLPLEKIVIETDAPFLAPVPHRGKRNEPAFVVEVGKKIAEIKKISVKVLSEQIIKNTKELFYGIQ